MVTTTCDCCGKPINWAVKIRTAVTLVPHRYDLKLDKAVEEQFKNDELASFTQKSLYEGREHEVCFDCMGRIHAAAMKEVDLIRGNSIDNK